MLRIWISYQTFSHFVTALACNSFLAIQRENLQTSMEIVTSTYSSDMRNLIMYLLTNPTRLKTVNDLMPMIGKSIFFPFSLNFSLQIKSLFIFSGLTSFSLNFNFSSQIKSFFFFFFQGFDEFFPQFYTSTQKFVYFQHFDEF